MPAQQDPTLSKIRPQLIQESLQQIIADTEIKDVWIPDENRRKQHYRQIISSVDAVALIGMVRCLHWYREQQMAMGRLHISHENFLRDAERALTGELAIVLSIPESEVPARMMELIK